MTSPQIFISGYILSLSLIVAIGAQNAFVLRQGLRRQYVLPVVLFCAFNDAFLFLIGAVGFGTLVERIPAFTSLAAWGGALFLFIYGLLTFRSAYQGGSMDDANPIEEHHTLRATMLTIIAISLLNPHVYLDTIVLVGGLAGQHPMPERLFFWLGAASSSFSWFFLLGYGAGFLAPLFKREIAWRILDVIIGIIMWTIAFTLLRGELGF